MPEPTIQLRDALWAIFKELRGMGYQAVSVPHVRDMLRLRMRREPGNFLKAAVATTGCYAAFLTASCHGVPHFLLVRQVPAELVKIGWPTFSPQGEKSDERSEPT